MPHDADFAQSATLYQDNKVAGQILGILDRKVKQAEPLTISGLLQELKVDSDCLVRVLNARPGIARIVHLMGKDPESIRANAPDIKESIKRLRSGG